MTEVFALISSPTEAKSLIPTIQALQRRFVSTRVTIVAEGHLCSHVRSAAAMLKAAGLDFDGPGSPRRRGLRKSLEDCSPILALVGNDNIRYGRLLIDLCSTRGIPVFLIQEGATGYVSVAKTKFRRTIRDFWDRLAPLLRYLLVEVDYSVLFRYLPFARNPNSGRYGVSRVRCFYVFAECCVIRAREAGSKALEIKPSGLPIFDTPVRTSPRLLFPCRVLILGSELYLDESCPIQTSIQETGFYESARQVLMKSGLFSEVEVRLHPSFPTAKRKSDYGNLKDQLAYYDVVIGFGSTALIEACAFGAKVLNFGFSSTPKNFVEEIFQKAGASFTCWNDLTDALSTPAALELFELSQEEILECVDYQHGSTARIVNDIIATVQTA